MAVQTARVKEGSRWKGSWRVREGRGTGCVCMLIGKG